LRWPNDHPEQQLFGREIVELIDQHTKRIMEGCKRHAWDAGLRFKPETLEYIVTNRDLIEISPKMMIPTLYDYWVHDVEVLKGRGRYELYPSNPYETVINTRPAISFYNDNNPDWMNVMIFYHVLAHIDFFQNNLYFGHTWDYDFTGQALADKRMIAGLRSEKGRWVDYVIEFTRGIDNLVGYHRELSRRTRTEAARTSERLDFYFDVFLQTIAKVTISEYLKEIERYNARGTRSEARGEDIFFIEVGKKHPEFETLFEKHRRQNGRERLDLVQYLMAHSPFLQKRKNQWMKAVMEVVRKTSLFFQPQIRTKILNEGWASYWHERLFLEDERIAGHEVDFARTHAEVTTMPRVGLNPYGLGLRLFQYIEELGDKGKYSLEFRRLRDQRRRRAFDADRGRGKEFIFEVRENLCDFTFINVFLDQDFIDRHRLFVAGRKLDRSRMVWQYFVKSRNAARYRQMVFDSLYHPPHITIDARQSPDDALYLFHHFEGKPLVKDYIANTMLGIEYFWGAPVHLETSEVSAEGAPATAAKGAGPPAMTEEEPSPAPLRWERVRYTMKDRKLAREVIASELRAAG
jgi:stage V sporulation protein R